MPPSQLRAKGAGAAGRALLEIDSKTGEIRAAAAAPSSASGESRVLRAISFLGETRAGKSTLINGLLQQQMARIAAADQHGATTAGMRAFDWGVTDEHKVLLVDCEGTDAARFGAPAEAAPIAGADMEARNKAVAAQVPRLAFLASAVVVLVSPSDLSVGTYFKFTTHFARQATRGAQRADRPALVLVQNMAVSKAPSPAGDDGRALAEDFFKLHDPERSMLSLFSQLRCFRLPPLQQTAAYDAALKSLRATLLSLAKAPAAGTAASASSGLGVVSLNESQWQATFTEVVHQACHGGGDFSVSFADATLVAAQRVPEVKLALKVYTVVKEALDAEVQRSLAELAASGRAKKADGAPYTLADVQAGLRAIERHASRAAALAAGRAALARRAPGERTSAADHALLNSLREALQSGLVCAALCPIEEETFVVCELRLAEHGAEHRARIRRNKLSRSQRKAHKLNFFKRVRAHNWAGSFESWEGAFFFRNEEAMARSAPGAKFTTLVLESLPEAVRAIILELERLGLVYDAAVKTALVDFACGQGKRAETMLGAVSKLLQKDQTRGMSRHTSGALEQLA